MNKNESTPAGTGGQRQNTTEDGILTQKIICGKGLEHTNNPESANPRPYFDKEISFIYYTAENPQKVKKEKSLWYILSSHPSRSHAEQLAHGWFCGVCADIDDVKGKTFDEVFNLAVSAIGANFLMYTTVSATEDNPRCRIVVPLNGTVNGIKYVRLARVLNNKLQSAGLVPDLSAQRVGQMFFLPNRGAFYAHRRHDEAGWLHTSAWSKELEKIQAREQEQEQEQAQKPKATQSGRESAIAAFNAATSIPSMLEKYGYTQHGKRWTAPGSKNAPGVRLTPDGEKWFSSHEKDKGIGMEKSDGVAGDAFDLYVHYEHGGNWAAALKAVRGQYGDPRPPCVDVDEPPAWFDEQTPPPPCEDHELEPLAGYFEEMAAEERQEAGAEKEEKGGGQDNHAYWARRARDRIGKDDVFSTKAFIYIWDEKGVWKKTDEETVKQVILKAIEGKLLKVTNAVVSSILKLFITQTFLDRDSLNLGGSETVNCLNGELSLIDGDWKLLQHNREHYRTTQIPVKYDAEAQAPRFEQFLCEVFQGDPDADEKRQAILEMIGYSLMTHCRYERFVILVGGGANGKSVLLAVLEALLGRANVAGVQPSQFDRSFQRAHLHEKLANVVTEIKQGEVIDDASLKGIVSGELTTVEHKFKDPFDMHPYCTCWFGTNHMPHTRDFSDALYRRAVIIQFNRVFKPEMGNCDTRLKEKLLAELPGILKLSLDAYARAVVDGFTTPASCTAARDEWRLEADQVAQFVEDMCERDPGAQTETQVLFNAYKDWAAASGIHKLVAIKTFGDRLVRLNFTRERTAHARCIAGIKLIDRPVVDLRLYSRK